MAALDDHSPDDIFCSSDVFDIDFHPAADIVALGTISGVVQVYVRCSLAWRPVRWVRNARANGIAFLLHVDWSQTLPVATNVCCYC